MYPRANASPPRIAVGPVVQISDGAVQTSGVSIRIVPEGGSPAAGGGTVSYEDGVVLYVPTQAETNHIAFVVIAHKTGCIPNSVSIVTTEESTPGRVSVGSNNDKAGYSISGTKTTLDDLNDIASTAIVTGGAITTSGGAVSNVTTVANMRGTDGANTITPDNAAITAIGGIVTSIASALPGDFALLVIDGNGHVVASNMRGTDGANTVAPDNSSIAAILQDTDTTLPLLIQALSGDVEAVGQVVQTIQTIAAKLDGTLEDDEAGGHQFTTLALENGPSGSGGSGGDANLTQILGEPIMESAAGQLAAALSYFFSVTTPTKRMNDVGSAAVLSGPNDVTITVTDGTNAIENATVRIHRTGEGETKTTGSNGSFEPFTVDSATWTVSITAAGFAGQSFELVVADDVDVTYQLTASSGGGSTGWLG